MRPRPVVSSPRAHGRSAGFTLIEIMVVVVIVAALLGIGLPAYNSAMQKARRTDAKDMLLQVANRQEQFMLDRSIYTDNIADLGNGWEDPMESVEGHYEVTRIAGADCEADATNCYVLQATPVEDDPQENDELCAAFFLASTGAKSAEEADGTANDECW